MSNFIPDKQDRIKSANEIGNKLYKDNWNTLIDSLAQIDSRLAEFVKEIPYGTIYPREKLSLEYREIAAITSLTQLNLKPQLKSHVIAALNVGLSRDQLVELFLHLSQFIGFPLILDGLRVAKEVFEHYQL